MPPAWLPNSAAANSQGEQAVVLLRETGYFRDNQLRMNYLEMREEEWPIGSAWSKAAPNNSKGVDLRPRHALEPPGAENLLPVRAAILSQCFEELWACVYNSPRTKTHPFESSMLTGTFLRLTIMSCP